MILAVDPGKTTGWATWNDLTEKFDCGQVSGRYTFMDWLGDRFWNGELVVEKFTITSATAQMSKQYDALYLIGYMDGCTYGEEGQFTLQTPSHVKRFITDEVLRKLGWWRKGAKFEHAMDAARHLATYLVDTGRGKFILDAILDD